MLEISKNNLFISKDGHSKYGIVDVLSFYDLEGTNWVFLHKDNSTLKYAISNRCLIYNTSNLEDVLSKENLFRIGLVVIDSNVDIISIVRRYTNLPIIITTDYRDIDKFDLYNYNYAYEFFTKKSEDQSSFGSYNVLTSNYKNMVRDLDSGDEYELDAVKVSRIHDKKIDDIMGLDNLDSL